MAGSEPSIGSVVTDTEDVEMQRPDTIEATLERVCFRTTLEGASFSVLETIWTDPKTGRRRQVDVFVADAVSSMEMRSFLERDGILPYVNAYNAALLVWSDVPKETFRVSLSGRFVPSAPGPLRFDAISARLSLLPELEMPARFSPGSPA